MRKLKSIIAVICAFSILVGFTVISAAVPVDECSYTRTLDNRDAAPPVETAEIEDSCLYYSILSTAGSYAKKYFCASDEEADFNEESFAEAVGDADIHNFGDVLYKSVGCNIGNGYAITSVEFLSNRGERYLKEKISENGAIAAAIAIPGNGGLTNATYYNEEEHSFAYTKPDENNDKYHAISIVGWDDNYDRAKYNKDSKGKSLGKKNGAWICKNSYGTTFGDDGYFYMSYTTPLLYAAALEVSQVSGINMILKSNELINKFGFVYGVNIRAFISSTEDVTVTVGGKTAFQGEVELKNGCNLILFEHPVLNGKVNVTGDNISTASDTIYCYWSLLPIKDKMTVKPAVKDESWIEDVQSILISVKSGIEYCSSTNPSIDHIIRKNSNDNCYYIMPADGYRFTKDTVIKDISGFDNNYLYVIYGDDYCEFEPFTTIEEVLKADYKRIKNGDGTFKTMIEFDPAWGDGRGMLKIVGQGIGSAYVNELNILTDESGMIKSTMLTFDDGSVLTVDTEVSLFSDESLTESIYSINGLEQYFAQITVSGYYSENLTVKIDGVPTECEIYTDGSETTVNVKISIPDITENILKTFKAIKEFIIQLLDSWRFKRR